MSRYLIEVAYRGTRYAGFQKQHNANTIQHETELALRTYFRAQFSLTGSSRTDAGVHAKQNFFHFDYENLNVNAFDKAIYHLNAILPADIVIKSIRLVQNDFHCRFSAVARTYEYRIYQEKDPFQQDQAFYYPYKIDLGLLQSLANELLNHNDFESFAKRNSQVFTFNCKIDTATWHQSENYVSFNVTANRFLRGMVKGLVGTMLNTSTKNGSLTTFQEIIRSKDPQKSNFNVPSHALTLTKVWYLS